MPAPVCATTARATCSHTCPSDLTTPGWLAQWDRRLLDLGTGDGAYARMRAREDPSLGMIALDLRLDRLPTHARRPRALANLLLVEADAVAWCLAYDARPDPPRFDEVTITFPYGALLRACIAPEGGFLRAVSRLLTATGVLAIRLNERALLDSVANPCWDEALDSISSVLETDTRASVRVTPMGASALRTFPSSWAKRIGWGRPTRAACITLRRRVMPTFAKTDVVALPRAKD
ncbi:MAG: hypothetical protein WBA46_08490 [Thermomicrobiales bacterium]